MSTSSRPRGPLSALRDAAAPALLLAYGVGAVLAAAHAGHSGELAPAVHALRDSTLALPMALLVVLVATAAGRAALRWAGLPARGPADVWLRTLLPAAAYALAVVPAGVVHAVLFPAQGHASPARDAALALVAGLGVLSALQAARLLRAGGRRSARAALAGATGLVVLAGVAPAQAAGAVTSPPTAATQDAVRACTAGTADRRYDVAAIDVHIAYNAWGDANPNGKVFVLQSDKSAVKNWHRPLSETDDKRRLRPRPLVLRANEGECVQVRLTNELDADPGDGLPTDPRVSMSVRGLAYDVQTSGGSHAGYNDDTTVGAGESVTQYWVAPQEGTYLFQDTAVPAGGEGDGGLSAYGLHGALVVEPAGSVWRDPRTGKRLYSETGEQSGELYLDAVIDPPSGRTFRETVQLAQDELPHTSEFAFNFGSEPQRNREHARCPDCVGEETSLSSWAYGDPATVKLASGLGPWQPGQPGGAGDLRPRHARLRRRLLLHRQRDPRLHQGPAQAAVRHGRRQGDARLPHARPPVAGRPRGHRCRRRHAVLARARAGSRSRRPSTRRPSGRTRCSPPTCCSAPAARTAPSATRSSTATCTRTSPRASGPCCGCTTCSRTAPARPRTACGCRRSSRSRP